MSNVAIFCAFVPLKSIPLEIYPVLQQSEQHPVYGMSYQKCWLFEMDQVSEYYGAAEPPWLRNPGNNHLASSFTQPADSIIKTVGRNPMFMSPPIHEYSCAMKSHFRKFGNQSSSTRKSPILSLMTYPFLFGYWSKPCRICGAQQSLPMSQQKL